MLDNHTSLSNLHVPLVLDCSYSLSSVEKSASRGISCSAIGKQNKKKRVPLCVIIHYKEVIPFITTAAQSFDSDEVRNKRLKDFWEFDCSPVYDTNHSVDYSSQLCNPSVCGFYQDIQSLNG